MASGIEFRGNWHRDVAALHAWTGQRRELALEAELPIIDAHHHLLDSEEHGRYLIPELMQDVDTGHNVVATVYVESGVMYRREGPIEMRTIGEVEFANSAAAIGASGCCGQTRTCAAIVAMADLMLGDRVQPVLDAVIAAGSGRVRGIRHSTPWDSGAASTLYRRRVPRHQLLDPAFRAGFARLEPTGLSFDAWLFYPQMPELGDLLRAFPDTSVILNHIGGLLGVAPHDGDRNAVFDAWRAHLRNLAQYPNLSVKVGGLGMLYSGWDFHLRDVPPSSVELADAWRPYVETCIETFGANRCMFESNFPATKQSCGYDVLWNAMKRITQACPAAEKEAMYSGTASRVYRLS